MSKYGICQQSVVPVRKQPSDRSEMVNQLLYGDLVKILDTSEGWLLISSSHDNYEGWIDPLQIAPIHEDSVAQLNRQTVQFINTACTSARDATGREHRLVMGSKIYAAGNSQPETGIDELHFTDLSVLSGAKRDIGHLLSLARSYEGAPYLWGGRSPFGIDCSGFTQIVFAMAGVPLLRDASQQATQGTLVDFIEEAKAGDLAFFDNAEGNIIHVGILLGRDQILHASGSVHMDPIDHHGIFRSSQNKYSHQLRFIKRFL